jgi:hypothetical protein
LRPSHRDMFGRRLLARGVLAFTPRPRPAGGHM